MTTEGDLGLTKETILELPLESLAFVVLENYAEANSWNLHNWMLGAQRNLGRGVHLQALAEAWSWLEAKALVARNPDQSSADARIITRAGKRVLDSGSVLEIQAAERIGLDLHHRLIGKVRPIFLLGDYETAAFKQ